MDFPLAGPIRGALAQQLELGDYGYTRRLADRALPEIFTEWAERRFRWTVDPARIVGLADIVQGIYLTLELFSVPGDGIVTLTPVYPPLWRSVEETGRRLLASTLVRGTERYEIDFDHLESCLRTGARILLLCNPHNPSGRAFTRSELESIGELAIRHDVIVLADEIHADLVYAPHRHVPFASLSPELAERTITMTSATKSFNIGGLRFAIAVFGGADILARFNSMPERFRGGLNSLGVIATEVAWRDCEGWLDRLVAYLASNRDYAVSELARRLPALRVLKPEATFLAWLDCRHLSLHEDPFSHYLSTARVAFSDGRDFGDGGEGFVRLNFATSRAILAELIERTVAATPP